MAELRGKTPEAVRKEVWAHVLAYNLIRTVMAQAAARHEVLDAIATHRVADRPGRFEPRLKKRRKDDCGLFIKPSAELKRMMAKRTYEK